MGTNFYAVKRLPRSIKGKICEMIENDRYGEAEDLFQTNYQKVHIGKLSYGWKFLFNYNHFKYYELNRESIDSFLRNKEITLYDEYNRVIPIDEFWLMVDKNQNKIDNKEYYKNTDNKSFLLLNETIPFDLTNKYDVEYYEFYSDGLRFSSSTDFS